MIIWSMISFEDVTDLNCQLVHSTTPSDSIYYFQFVCMRVW